MWCSVANTGAAVFRPLMKLLMVSVLVEKPLSVQTLEGLQRLSLKEA